MNPGSAVKNPMLGSKNCHFFVFLLFAYPKEKLHNPTQQSTIKFKPLNRLHAKKKQKQTNLFSIEMTWKSGRSWMNMP